MTITSPILTAVAFGCALAAFVWLRSSFRLERSWRRIERMVGEDGVGRDAAALAHFAFRKELHTGLLYLILAGALAFASLSNNAAFDLPLVLLGIPVLGTLIYGRRFLRQAQEVEARVAAGAPSRGGHRAGGRGAARLGGTAGAPGPARTTPGSRSARSTRPAPG